MTLWRFCSIPSAKATPLDVHWALQGLICPTSTRWGQMLSLLQHPLSVVAVTTGATSKVVGVCFADGKFPSDVGTGGPQWMAGSGKRMGKERNCTRSGERDGSAPRSVATNFYYRYLRINTRQRSLWTWASRWRHSENIMSSSTTGSSPTLEWTRSTKELPLGYWTWRSFTNRTPDHEGPIRCLLLNV